ncbi:hypothetical protein HYT23_05765 [Candidatus Pacearchaeota archaeon]|nr:hypothetical protein [Candidatus Pacearchaeota archaeon]
MKPIDYRKKFKLEEKSVEVDDTCLEEAVAQTMGHFTNLGNYSVRNKQDSDLVIFGRSIPNQIEMGSDDALLISENLEHHRDIPSVVLRYGVYPREIIIGYIQTPSYVDFEAYGRIKSDLGVRPHDLILAHFLDRISPVLDKFPDTNVFFSPIYLEKSVYPFLRDRFLDGDYFLNPRRVRVQQIMGGENFWLRGESAQDRFHAQKNIKNRLLLKTNFLDLFV